MKKSEIREMVKKELESINEGKITSKSVKKDVVNFRNEIESIITKVTDDTVKKLEKKYVGSTVKFMHKESDGPMDWKEVKRSGKIVKARYLIDAEYYQSKFSFHVEYIDRDGDKNTASIGEKALI